MGHADGNAWSPDAEFARAIGIADPVAIEAHDLIELDVPPREELLAPWLQQQSLCMLHAWRGLGKTWLNLSLAICVAAGAPLLSWTAPKARRVLYIDGEMPLAALQERTKQLMESIGTPGKGMLRFITPDLQTAALPNLADPLAQRAYDRLIDDAEFVIIDNLSALLKEADENDAASWLSVAGWALQHRRQQRAVLFVHHSGKSGRQRGTSKREDFLDVVIALRRPADYDETQGARFEVHFEKCRGLTGDAAGAIDMRLQEDERGRLIWTSAQIVAANVERIAELWNLGGLNVTEIAREVELHKSNVIRNLRKAKELGLLTREYEPRNK